MRTHYKEKKQVCKAILNRSVNFYKLNVTIVLQLGFQAAEWPSAQKHTMLAPSAHGIAPTGVSVWRD